MVSALYLQNPAAFKAVFISLGSLGIDGEDRTFPPLSGVEFLSSRGQSRHRRKNQMRQNAMPFRQSEWVLLAAQLPHDS